MNTNPMDEARVLEVLAQVIDPEIGCNLVDLGLIYSVQITGSTVAVKMTLTTQGCPMHDSLVRGVETALLGLEGVKRADVELVWDPPWNPSMMSAAGRRAAGIGG